MSAVSEEAYMSADEPFLSFFMGVTAFLRNNADTTTVNSLMSSLKRTEGVLGVGLSAAIELQKNYKLKVGGLTLWRRPSQGPESRDSLVVLLSNLDRSHIVKVYNALESHPCVYDTKVAPAQDSPAIVSALMAQNAITLLQWRARKTPETGTKTGTAMTMYRPPQPKP
jgi:hypothetical protein